MSVIICSIFLLVPPVLELYAIIGISYSPSKWRKYLPFHILMVFILCYTYDPIYEIDLTRYFEMVRDLSKISNFSGVISYGEDGLFVRNILFWIIGKLQDVHLLPAITGSIIYGVAGYITCDYSCENHFDKFIPWFFFFQLFMLPMTAIISNVRNITAFALLILAVYFDLIKGKRGIGVVLLYVLPCFLHVSGILFVIFRVIVIFFKRIKFPIVLAVLLIPLVLQVLYDNLSIITIGGSFGTVIRNAIIKGYTYAGWNRKGLTDYEAGLLASRYAYVQRLFMMSFAAVVFVFISLFSNKNEENADNRNVAFNQFVFLVCLITLACNLFIAPNYWRFYCAVVIASPVVIIPKIRTTSFLTNKNGRLYLSINNIVAVLLFIYTIGGSLINIWNAPKYVDTFDWFKGVLLTNPYTIIFRLLRNLL